LVIPSKKGPSETLAGIAVLSIVLGWFAGKSGRLGMNGGNYHCKKKGMDEIGLAVDF
jgi:hypothetical protein